MSILARRDVLSFGAFQFSEAGLLVDGNPAYDEWESAIDRLRRIEGAVQWWIGDALNYGEHAYGEKYSQALNSSEEKTWQQYAWLAKRFPTSTRGEVSWSHHREVASLPDKEARALLKESAKEGWSIRVLGQQVRRLQRDLSNGEPLECCTVEDLDTLARSGAKFGTLYADPPWQYENQGTRAATDNHYQTMSLDDIAALPVAQLSAPSSHLHLWTTNAFLKPALDLLDKWGFEFKSTFVWVKPQLGIGNYWRCSHELLLLGVRGGLPFPPTDIRSWIQRDRTEHSAKPEDVRLLIERVSPGPRLELFARLQSHGWVSWGNEIERRLFDAVPFESAG